MVEGRWTTPPVTGRSRDHLRYDDRIRSLHRLPWTGSRPDPHSASAPPCGDGDRRRTARAGRRPHRPRV